MIEMTVGSFDDGGGGGGGVNVEMMAMLLMK